MTRLLARAAILAVCALLAVSAWAIFAGRNADPFAKCRSTAIAGGAGAIGGPFTLVDQTGRTVTDADVITQPTLVYFGYSFCPDICPFDLARNAEAVDILEEGGIEATPVFISVDPKRDTPEHLAEYAENLHPRLVALSGTPEQVKAAADAYKVYFSIQDGDPESYLVDHSTFTYLMLPKIGFVDFFKREATADEIADKVSCFAGAA
jgi:protein SCO1/2